MGGSDDVPVVEGIGSQGRVDLVRALAGASGAGIGLLVAAAGDPVSGALAGPAVTPALEQLAYGALARLRGHGVLFVEEAKSTDGGHSAEELIARSLADDTRLQLLRCALDAAVTSDDEQKIRALARAYARGVFETDDGRVNEYLRVVVGLAALDTLDVRVLHEMARPGEPWQARRLQGDQTWRIIVEVVPAVTKIVDSVVARLSTLGLITESSGGGGVQWRGPAITVTEFGRLCLQALEDVGSEW